MKIKNSGFSLVEVIISIMLIAVIIITSFQFLIHCESFAMKADAKIAATYFARETLEDLCQKPYTDESLAQGDHDATNTPSLALPTGAAFGSRLCDRYGGTRTYTVGEEKTDDLTGTNYRVIEVTVAWNE